MKEITVLTLNIRRCKGDDGINVWEKRRDLVARILEQHKPDVAVFQEVLAHQLKDLISMLPDYKWTGVGRDDGVEAGEFSPIFYKGLDAPRTGNFWLSDTPDEPSCSWPGMTRICTWAEFAGDAPFALFNTHIEYQFESTQLKSIDLFRQRAEEFPEGFPVLLTGDFNFNPSTPPYDALKRSFQDSFYTAEVRDVDAEDEAAATYHGYTGRTAAAADQEARIDYIWHRGNLEVARYRIETGRAGAAEGVYPSDHWPVVCRVGVPSVQ